MDTSQGGIYWGLHFEQFLEVLRYAVAIISAAVTLPFWSRSKVSRGERWAFAVAAAVVVFLVWPADFSYCKNLPIYHNLALIFLVVSVVAGLAYMYMNRHYGHTHYQKEAPGGLITVVVEKSPTSWLLVLHKFCALCAPLALLAALAATLGGLVLDRGVQKAHVKLSIYPSDSQPMVAGHVLNIIPTMHECHSGIGWDIEGLSSPKSEGKLGEVSKTGTYSAPSSIDQELELYVVAIPDEHPWELQKVKIQLRAHPKYSTPLSVGGKDSDGKQADFIIEVLDKRYSWMIGKNAIKDVDGSIFASKMADDGLFSGFSNIICVGAASREFQKSASQNTREDIEQARAKDRANVLGRWVRHAYPLTTTNVQALKIGRYDEEGQLPPDQTAKERQVVIVGVVKADKDTNLVAALHNAFTRMRVREPLLGMYVDKYPVGNWALQLVQPEKPEQQGAKHP
jgi:hypothetical protein